MPLTKSIIIGNGINIQFDEKKDYTCSAIMERVVSNIKAGKYQQLFDNQISADNLLELLNALCSVIDAIVNGQYQKEAFDAGGLLAIVGEYQEIKEYYAKTVPNTYQTVGLEDFFFALEVLNIGLSKKVRDSEEHTEIIRKGAFEGLREMIVDGIFNGGIINDLYKQFPDSLHNFFRGYKNIFTINYDLNLDRFLPGKEIIHLHGSFNQKAKSAPTKQIVGLEHVNCNAVMSWSWLDKYGSYLDENLKRDKTKLSQVDGEVSVLGVSPRNDEQIFLLLSMNPNVSSIVYYYKESKGINVADVSAEIKKHIRGKSVTVRSVDNLWAKYQ